VAVDHARGHAPARVEREILGLALFARGRVDLLVSYGMPVSSRQMWEASEQAPGE
jgi:hypothetical protein